MRAKKLTQAIMGEEINTSGQNFGKKLQDMSFKYDELVAVFNILECPAGQMFYFMTGETK